MSGEIMITGARSRQHLEICYHFISNFINSRRNDIELK